MVFGAATDASLSGTGAASSRGARDQKWLRSTDEAERILDIHTSQRARFEEIREFLNDTARRGLQISTDPTPKWGDFLCSRLVLLG